MTEIIRARNALGRSQSMLTPQRKHGQAASKSG
jgi:hypothetical protein